MASITAAAVVGGSLISSVVGASAAGSAASTQANAANNATAEQQAQFQQTQANLAPWMQAGTNALGQLQSQAPALLTAPNQANFQASPGYGYQMQQMQDAVQNSAAARGSAISGNTLQALQSNAQGLASQDYWNWYNAQTANQNRSLNYLQTLSGGGQNAAAQLGAYGTQTAGNIANTMQAAGNASAAGTMGMANAIGGGINNASSNYLLYNMMNGAGGGGGFGGSTLVGQGY